MGGPNGMVEKGQQQQPEMKDIISEYGVTRYVMNSDGNVFKIFYTNNRPRYTSLVYRHPPSEDGKLELWQYRGNVVKLWYALPTFLSTPTTKRSSSRVFISQTSWTVLAPLETVARTQGQLLSNMKVVLNVLLHSWQYSLQRIPASRPTGVNSPLGEMLLSCREPSLQCLESVGNCIWQPWQHQLPFGNSTGQTFTAPLHRVDILPFLWKL